MQFNSTFVVILQNVVYASGMVGAAEATDQTD